MAWSADICLFNFFKFFSSSAWCASYMAMSSPLEDTLCSNDCCIRFRLSSWADNLSSNPAVSVAVPLTRLAILFFSMPCTSLKSDPPVLEYPVGVFVLRDFPVARDFDVRRVFSSDINDEDPIDFASEDASVEPSIWLVPDFRLLLDFPVREADRRLLLGLDARDFLALALDLTLAVAAVPKSVALVALDAVELTLVAAEIMFSVLFNRFAKFFSKDAILVSMAAVSLSGNCSISPFNTLMAFNTVLPDLAVETAFELMVVRVLYWRQVSPISPTRQGGR